MANIPDATVAQAITDANAAVTSLQSAIALLTPSGTTWSRSAINASYSNNDLTVAATGPSLVPTTLFELLSGRYGEVVVGNAGQAGYLGIGIIAASQPLNNPPVSLAAVPAGLWVWRDDGWIANNGVSSNGQFTYATGDNIGLYLSASAKVFGRKNGIWIGDPVAETGALFIGLPAGQYTIAAVFFGANGSPVVTGQFASTTYPVPAGASLYA